MDRGTSSATTRTALPVVTAAGAVALLPWAARLARTLPATTATPRWRDTWVAFDVMLAAQLTGTALAARNRWRSAPLWTTASAALVLADAFFDVSLTPRPERSASVASAAVSVPAGIALLAAARRQLPR